MPPKLVVQFRQNVVVDLWPHILPDPRLARGYNEREIEVLTRVQFFRVNTFLGSGAWKVTDCATFKAASRVVDANPRSMIYAAGFFGDEVRLANMPAIRQRSEALLEALHRVGKRDGKRATRSRT